MCEVSGVYPKQKQSLTLCSREEVKFTNITFRNNSAMKTGFGGIALRNVNLMVTDYIPLPQKSTIFSDTEQV